MAKYHSIALLLVLFTSLAVSAQENTPSYLPELHGTIRSKYEYQPDIDAGRFEVRNARFSLSGKVTPYVAYKAEIDLCDEGTIKMLDAYTRLTPWKNFQMTLGQMRVPFTIIIDKLYEASASGVEVKMLVRGNCSLVTGVPGLSETMHLTGIIDRYLEHSRILIFANGGEEKYYIGSADWMPRNLDHRIEVLTPIYEPEIQADLRRVVEYRLQDTSQGRIVDGTGGNCPLPSAEGQPLFRSQEALYNAYLTQENTQE